MTDRKTIYPTVQFRAGDLLSDLICRRQDGETLGSIAQRDLQRYYTLINREERRLRLTDAEVHVIQDALRGTVLDETTASVIEDEIADALMYDGLGAKWTIDDAKLMAKLADATAAQKLALVDAVERASSRPACGRGTTRSDCLASARETITPEEPHP